MTVAAFMFPTFISTAAAPPPPETVVSTTQSANSISVQWSGVNEEGVMGYMLTYNPVNGSCEGVEGGKVMVDRNATTSLLEGLEEYMAYNITLQTKGGQGYGLPSPPVVNKTSPAGMAVVRVNHNYDRACVCECFGLP